MDIEKERLSSLWTIAYKFFFPVLWIGVLSVGVGSMWMEGLANPANAGTPIGVKVGMTAMLLVGSAFIYWTCVRLKRVYMDSRYLYVSNYFEEFHIPLSLVDHVTEFRWDNTHPVTIHFTRSTEVGMKVTFMPKMRALR